MLAIGLGASAGWGLIAAALLLIGLMWIDLAVDLAPGVRLAATAVAAGFGLLIVGRVALRTWQQSATGALARRLDRLADAQGQILSGIDLMPGVLAAGAGGGVTAGMARLAVERAASIARTIGPPAAAPLRPLYRSLIALGAIAAAVLLLSVSAPRLVATEWDRFADPYGDHPPYSPIEFTVTPGDAKVLYGGVLDIRATTGDVPVESAEIVLIAPDGGGQESLPMFPEDHGKWHATVANVTAPSKYFVRSGAARSRKFEISVITTPRIESVRFRLTPPAYTHRPPIEGPIPAGGISALPGSTVQLWAQSNRPLGSGMIETDAPQGVASEESSPAPLPSTQPVQRSSFAMKSVDRGATSVTAAFVVRQSGRLNLKVADVDGQASSDSFTASIQLLRDERPFVRIMQPQPESFATPEVALDVQIQAEDDYGVSRLELFRGLNESRVRSTVVPVPLPEHTRVPASVSLPLSAYALSPGDVVKLFARVEDNDPAGSKGSESPIVTIHIVSKEQMQQMLLAREGLETLLSKYEQASRRMEAANEKIDQLKKALEKADANSEISKEMRQQLENAAAQFAADADALTKLKTEDLPFDLDRALKEELNKTAAAMSDAAGAMSDLANRPGLTAGAAKDGLEEARKKLGTQRKEFKEEATDPLEHLGKIYPLIEDEARFIDLWQRQNDLAQRMDALTDHDGEDDPHLKSRMRDLEGEQRRLREDLRQLLDDIENHTAELPADTKLDDLRQTAKTFAAAVRKSAAGDQMAAAESGLAEFSGTRAHIAARSAAETLQSFIAQCQSVGEKAGEGLAFQPKLASGLGNTVQELLDAAGLGAEPGSGQGGSGGYSARRSSLRNVGLYGQIPVQGRQAGARGGSAMRGVGSEANGPAKDPLDSANGDPARIRASGQSDAAVPPRYQRRVGEYFQRVADELDQKPQQ